MPRRTASPKVAPAAKAASEPSSTSSSTPGANRGAGKGAPGRKRKEGRGKSHPAQGGPARASNVGPGQAPPDFGRGPAATPAWPVVAELFPPLDAAAQAALARLPEALARVRPLSAAHRRALPEDIAALSRALTAERAELRRPYWSRPAFVSAYLSYFLPWNLVRLMRLFRGLDLPAPGEAPALLLDAGSGPLTVPLALWLARPEWRGAPVRVLALDSAPQPLELGRALFHALGEVLGEPVWPVRLERGPLESLAARARPLLGEGCRPWLVTAANVLNEVRPARRGHGGARADEPDEAADRDADEAPGSGADALDESLDRLLGAWAPLFEAHAGGDGPAATPPTLLFVEPGTRLGGTTLMRLRALALEGGLSALAPCATEGPCPLRRGAWCHFTFSPQGAPRWLAELTEAAGLAKRSLSLSPLLLGLRPAGDAPGPAAPEARVLSSPFAVPGISGMARYACAACGLALLEDAGAVASGSLVPLGEAPGERPRRDARSGARIFAPPQARTRAPGNLKKKS